MEFVIKSGNRLEYQTRKKLLKGAYIVKFITINITAKNPDDLKILMMHRKNIEKAIVNDLNGKRKEIKK